MGHMVYCAEFEPRYVIEQLPLTGDTVTIRGDDNGDDQDYRGQFVLS